MIVLAVDVEKQLGALKLGVRFDAARGAGLEAVAYDAHWRSSDQIPLRTRAISSRC